jgi:hypothetical protein
LLAPLLGSRRGREAHRNKQLINDVTVKFRDFNSPVTDIRWIKFGRPNGLPLTRRTFSAVCSSRGLVAGLFDCEDLFLTAEGKSKSKLAFVEYVILAALVEQRFA